MQIQWPLWRRLLFRLFFIYLALTIAPWTWFDSVPGVSYITRYYYDVLDWLVRKTNALIFHVKDQLVPVGGSGDTSFGWAQLWFVLSVSLIGMLIWSILDRNKKDYSKLNYWLCLFTRYYVSLVAFSYGIIKLFALQMPFPNYSQLATPLGDFLPMRLSWMFIGYSTPYQFFSGLMEVLAGLLLLYRRTVTLGIVVATVVFINVAVLNFSYDIPVKIFSVQMVVCCLFLLAQEMERMLCFFVYNRPATICTIYQVRFPKKWMRIGRLVLKSAFVIVAVGMVFWESIKWKAQNKMQYEKMVFKPGLYNVEDYVVNGDTVPPLIKDTLRWQNIVFDNNYQGSIATSDPAFMKRYNRAYFFYKVDTAKRNLEILKSFGETAPVATLKYSQIEDDGIRFWGALKNDSISLVLRRSKHNFQLTDRQFHWLSESNR